jgi:hypothetical protein
MKKLLSISIIACSLAGCADATRTLPVLVMEDRPIDSIVYNQRAPLVVPPNYKDPVLQEYSKNNFSGNTVKEVKNVPLPTPRPYNLTTPPSLRK